MFKNTDIECGEFDQNDHLHPLLRETDTDERNRNTKPLRSVILPSIYEPIEPEDFQHNLPICVMDHATKPLEASAGINTTPSDNHPEGWEECNILQQRLNTKLLDTIALCDVEEVERLLKSGANPNATCHQNLISTCHAAAYVGGDILNILIEFGAEKFRVDKFGRTPLHLAAYAGNARQVALLLDIPEDKNDIISMHNNSSERIDSRKLMDEKCDVNQIDTELPDNWRDILDHKCNNYSTALFQPGWTALHVASACVQRDCIRLLLASGANPNIEDLGGRTALDVAGYAYYYEHEINEKHLIEVIQMLHASGGMFAIIASTSVEDFDTPLHTALDIESLEAIKVLLQAGASMTCYNKAGETTLHTCVRKKLDKHLQLLINHNLSSQVVNIKDKDGRSVLQSAVEAVWFPGVCIALQAGADITSKANNGDTAIHSAAALGNMNILNEILRVAKHKDVIDYQNAKGETALFKAITNGNVECVRQIIKEGANLNITLPGGLNVLHEAANRGYLEVLRVLLAQDETISQPLINMYAIDNTRTSRCTPLHIAVLNNRLRCVELLLSKGADINLRYSDFSLAPLHMAAVSNSVDIAKAIIEFDKTTVHEVDDTGWHPLHHACDYSSRDVITLLLREGADLSAVGSKETPIGLIFDTLSNPTEFMEDIFDSYISSNGKNVEDEECKVTLDYSVLMPNYGEMDQMKVIKALLKTGNDEDQQRLLIHPLLESFLYLKWKMLMPYFYNIIFAHSLFLISLTITVGSTYFYKDTGQSQPGWLSYSTYVCFAFWICKVIMECKLNTNKKFIQMETWVSLGATVFPALFLLIPQPYTEFGRHIATIALFLSWLDTLFLVSMFLNSGYYVLMFKIVALNVVKILLTFIFLVIGFTLSFMIQFRCQVPFDGPWAAFVKTIVMMMSEFEYEDLFDSEHLEEPETSLVIVRVIFLIFVILTGIVLMNLLVGMAVNDINDLKIYGHIKRLIKRVEFIVNINTAERKLCKILPEWLYQNMPCRKEIKSIEIWYPGRDISPGILDDLSYRLKETIVNKVQKQQRQIKEEQGIHSRKNKLNDEHDIDISLKTMKEPNKSNALKTDEGTMPKSGTEYKDIISRLNNIDEFVGETRGVLNKNIDQMKKLSTELQSIKNVLTLLESKLTR